MNPLTTEIDAIDCAGCEERTRLVYEDIPGCTPPPFFDLSACRSLKSLEPLGVTLNRRSELLVNVALRLVGARGLQQDLTALQELLRSVYLRTDPFPPAMSATVAIEDHPQPIEPLQRAAILLIAAREIHRDLISGRFSPDQYRGRNLEMGQYANLFSTQVIHDGRRFRLFKSTCTSHITVLAANKFYSVDFGTQGDVWSGPELLQALTTIRASSRTTADKSGNSSPAFISGAKPATQARIMAELLKDPTAAQSLNRMRHSFLTLCLDLDLTPASAAEAAAFAHSWNCANRWYNSALQIVVFGNSKACLIFNFSAYLDGNIQMRAASELWNRSAIMNFDGLQAVEKPRLALPRELRLPISPKLLDEARADVASVVDHQQSTFELADFGKSFFAAHNLDPVAAFVVALQLAVFRLTGRISRIRQLLTMSRYRYMDLATAIVTTRQMISFLESTGDSTATREQRRERLQEAIDSQIALCRTARRYFPVMRLPELLVETTRGIRRVYIRGIMKVTKRLLRVMGLADFGHHDIIISHPRVYKEVPILGRPGIRLPYVRCFGLHYQIFEDSITLTWMPGMDWKISNQDITNELVQCLRDLAEITRK